MRFLHFQTSALRLLNINITEFKLKSITIRYKVNMNLRESPLNMTKTSSSVIEL